MITISDLVITYHPQAYLVSVGPGWMNFNVGTVLDFLRANPDSA